MLWSAIAVSLMLQGAALPPQRDAKPPPRSERALLDSLEAAQLRFFAEWRGAWFGSANARRQFDDPRGGGARSRRAHLHCHPSPSQEYAPLRRTSLIQSRFSYYSVCPTWPLGDVAPTTDERNGIDESLDDAVRGPARIARQSLIAMFDAAATRLPANEWIMGQRVRLLVDQRDTDRALAITGDCAAARWWCEALKGYLFAERGEMARADSVFLRVIDLVPRAARCDWIDLSVLFAPPERAVYQKTNCAGRDALNEHIWWLSDPLYIDPMNERRAVHYARKVMVLLRTALDRDERYDWRLTAGGDVLENMLVRFGWPAFMYWGGVGEDYSHSTYLKDYDGPLNEPYTTFEYSRGRLHPVPQWSAIADPWTSRVADWDLAEPVARNEVGEIPYWWPREHFAPVEPLVQIPEGQVAFLRRQTNVLFAAAHELSGAGMLRPFTESIAASLLRSRGPRSMDTIAALQSSVGEPLVLRAFIDSLPALAAIEIPARARGGAPGARTRFGIVPPPPLMVMKPNEIASSDPVILRAPFDDDDVLPTETNAALDRMSGSMEVRDGGRVGVYWETYGFKPGDSVNVAVWIERYTPQGIARRFGIALNIVTDLNTPIVMSWREPNPGQSSRFLGGAVPIIARSLVVDVSRLPKGEYWLGVAVGKPGQQPARGRRSLVIP